MLCRQKKHTIITRFLGFFCRNFRMLWTVSVLSNKWWNDSNSFVLEDELFIAFGSSRASSGLYKTKLPVYVLQKNNFTMNQTLDSFSVFGVEYFTINCNHFLVVANQYNNSRNSQDRTVVHRWEAGEFKKFQLIPTNRVTDTHYFAINTRSLSRSVTISTAEWKYQFTNGKMKS